MRVRENIFALLLYVMTTSVVWSSDFLAGNPEVPGSIPVAIRFFWVAVNINILGPIFHTDTNFVALSLQVNCTD
jgi:hypothetical protein